MKTETKVIKKRETIQIALDPELKAWLIKEKEAAEQSTEKSLGSKTVFKMAAVAKGKLRARMADEMKSA